MLFKIVLKNKPHITIIIEATDKNELINKLWEDLNIALQEIETIINTQ